MELQWPLIVFTLFVSLGAGSLGVAGLLALLKKSPEVQLPATIVALAAVVLGGLASFLHLQHWERAFNGFGHITSGITQELIGIVVFVVVAAAYLVFVRRGSIPRWAGYAAVIVSAALVVVVANSYLMEARPVWDSPLLWLYYLANAVLFGSLVAALFTNMKKDDGEAAGAGADGGGVAGAEGAAGAGTDGGGVAAGGVGAADTLSKLVFVGAGVTLVALLAYCVYIPLQASAFADVGYYFDSTNPTKEMADPQAASAGFLFGGQAVLFWIGALLAGVLAPVALVFLARKRRDKGSLIGLSATGLVLALAGAACFRVTLYALGFTTFVFY
jgi:DMSO reductase anchor subunit